MVAGACTAGPERATSAGCTQAQGQTGGRGASSQPPQPNSRTTLPMLTPCPDQKPRAETVPEGRWNKAKDLGISICAYLGK